jgi:hypothetical protein
MWLFKKGRRTEIWDEAIAWPIGDIEAAEKIRQICLSAADSAEAVGGFGAGAQAGDREENRRYETERYESAARTAMEIAMKISDDLMRDASVSQIIDLCMKANDLRTARILFRAIQAVAIREGVQKEHPLLAE